MVSATTFMNASMEVRCSSFSAMKSFIEMGDSTREENLSFVLFSRRVFKRNKQMRVLPRLWRSHVWTRHQWMCYKWSHLRFVRVHQSTRRLQVRLWFLSFGKTMSERWDDLTHWISISICLVCLSVSAIGLFVVIISSIVVLLILAFLVLFAIRTILACRLSRRVIRFNRLPSTSEKTNLCLFSWHSLENVNCNCRIHAWQHWPLVEWSVMTH